MLGFRTKSNGKCTRRRESWIWTWRQEARFITAMDEDDADLIERLCTRAGMIMEDASVDALTLQNVPPDQRSVALAKLASAASQIAALVHAAASLNDYPSQ